MANKVTFASLKLKADDSIKTITILDNITLEVKQYLPIEDKIDLVEIALQKAEENGIYNEYLLEMYFHLNIVYLYSNLTFTDKQKENEAKLYDILESNGIINEIIAAIPEKEYNSLFNVVAIMKKDILTYKNTAGAVLQSVIQDLPKNAAAAKDIIDSFNPNNFQQVKELADMANATGMNNKVSSTIEE